MMTWLVAVKHGNNWPSLALGFAAVLELLFFLLMRVRASVQPVPVCGKCGVPSKSSTLLALWFRARKFLWRVVTGALNPSATSEG